MLSHRCSCIVLRWQHISDNIEGFYRTERFLQTLHDEFAQESVPAGKERLMLASAVAAGKSTIDTGYDIPRVAQYVMTYFFLKGNGYTLREGTSAKIVLAHF